MTVETATYVSSFSAANPAAGDAQTEGDNHLRLIKSVLQSTFPNAAKAFYFPGYAGKTGNYTVLAADMNDTIGFDATSAARTATMPSLSSGDDGWGVTIIKLDASANAVNIAAASVNGATSVSLSAQYDTAFVKWTGTVFLATIVSGGVVVSTVALTALQISGGTELTAIAVGDYFPIYDASAAANRKISALNILDIINALTEDTSPDLSADFALVWDSSASEAKKVKPTNLAAAAASIPSAATQAEMEAASITTAYATPGRTKYNPGVAKAWAKVTVTGGVPALTAGHNVTSVSDTAIGRMTVTFTTSFSNANYAAIVSIQRASTALGGNDRLACHVRNGGQAAGSLQVECYDEDGDPTDPDIWYIVCFGDFA
jgi:hypothetical protein